MKSFSILSIISCLAALASAAPAPEPAPAGGYDTSLPPCPYKIRIANSWGATQGTTKFLDDIGGPVIGNLDDSGNPVNLWQLSGKDEGYLQYFRSSSYLLYLGGRATGVPGPDGLISQDPNSNRQYTRVWCKKYKVQPRGYWRGPPPVYLGCSRQRGGYDRIVECTKRPSQGGNSNGGYNSYGSYGSYGSGSGTTDNPQSFLYMNKNRWDWNRLGCREVFFKAEGVTGVANYGNCNPTI